MGAGLPVPAPGMVPWRHLFALPLWTGDDGGQALAQHWYLDGFSSPPAIEIPYRWIAAGSLKMRTDRPITHAAVTKSGGGTAIASVLADEQIDFTSTTESTNDVDAPNRAHFTVTYYDEPRTRLSSLRFILNRRTVPEIWTLLGVEIGTRIQITGTPANWPEGATDLVVEGKAHSILGDLRVLAWNASPLIGEAVGQVGPFFRVGVSELDGTDLLPW